VQQISVLEQFRQRPIDAVFGAVRADRVGNHPSLIRREILHLGKQFLRAQRTMAGMGMACFMLTQDTRAMVLGMGVESFVGRGHQKRLFVCEIVQVNALQIVGGYPADADIEVNQQLSEHVAVYQDNLRAY
jgi:hypothetical protein